MTRSECRYCGRHAYKDGKCYADSRAGKPIEIYIQCYWAKKNNNLTKDKKIMNTENNTKTEGALNSGEAVLAREQQKRLLEIQERHREKVAFYDSLSREDRDGELGRLTLDEIAEMRVRAWRLSHDLGVKSNLRFTRAEKKAVLLGCIGGSVMAMAVFGLIIGIVMSV